MTYEQMERTLEELGYNLNVLTPESIEDIASAEGFRRKSNGKYVYFGY